MNSISKQILRSPQFFLKVLIGALLIYSIVGIPLFIGYVARYLQQYKDRRDVTLPQWNHGLALVIESWELLVLLLAYAVIPMSISYAFSSAIDHWFGYLVWIPLWVIPWIPTMILFFICPLLVSIAYTHYLKIGNFEVVLNFKCIFRDFYRSAEELIVITLMFWGTLLIGFPIFGFTVALSLILYFLLVFHTIDNNR